MLALLRLVLGEILKGFHPELLLLSDSRSSVPNAAELLLRHALGADHLSLGVVRSLSRGGERGVRLELEPLRLGGGGALLEPRGGFDNLLHSHRLRRRLGLFNPPSRVIRVVRAFRVGVVVRNAVVVDEPEGLVLGVKLLSLGLAVPSSLRRGRRFRPVVRAPPRQETNVGNRVRVEPVRDDPGHAGFPQHPRVHDVRREREEELEHLGGKFLAAGLGGDLLEPRGERGEGEAAVSEREVGELRRRHLGHRALAERAAA